MGELIARLGDTSDHGGTIITSCSKTRAEGPRVARRGDLHSCPIPGHGITPIVSNTSPNVITEGNETAHTGSICGCGARIISGAVKTRVP